MVKRLLRKIILEKRWFSQSHLSQKNVLRGLHLQTKKSQDKLITCLKGKILDVAVDLRRNSKTFGKYHKVIIREKILNHFSYQKVLHMAFLV